MPEIWSWEEKFGVDNSVEMCKKVFLVLNASQATEQLAALPSVYLDLDWCLALDK